MASWKLKRGESEEFEVPDLATLREWAVSGRVRQSDYVYNPTLERWMYVRDLAEVSEVVTTRQERDATEKLNSASWFIAGIGLLACFAFWPAGIALIVIAICMSAFHHLKKRTLPSDPTRHRPVAIAPPVPKPAPAKKVAPPRKPISQALRAFIMVTIGIGFMVFTVYVTAPDSLPEATPGQSPEFQAREFKAGSPRALVDAYLQDGWEPDRPLIYSADTLAKVVTLRRHRSAGLRDANVNHFKNVADAAYVEAVSPGSLTWLRDRKVLITKADRTFHDVSCPLAKHPDGELTITEALAGGYHADMDGCKALPRLDPMEP